MNTRRKTSRSKGKNQQQTQPPYGIPWVPEVFSRLRRGASFRRPQAEDTSGEAASTRARLVRGESSHHYASLVSLGARDN